MKRALIALLLTAASLANAAPKVRLEFVEVLQVRPKYVEVPCDPNICQGTPDLRQVGSYIYYRCDGQLYENWVRISINAGMLVQVANCKNLVVTDHGEPIVTHP